MPACEECYRTKKSCDREQRNGHCSRCVRLEMPCVARISRQGQGPKKRNKTSLPESTTTCSAKRENPVDVASEDCEVLQAFLQAPSSIAPSPKFHYGVRYLIHSWTSFALARRSFRLLERACHLASKCEIPMDDIFCPARRNVVQPLLYNQQVESDSCQEVSLGWDDIPQSLRDLCRLDSLENRYIMIRQAKNGYSHYLASDRFQHEIASVWLMEQTWKANEIHL